MRRKIKRILRQSIKISCSLETGGGNILHGFTRSLSSEGVFVESHGIIPQSQRSNMPKVGEMGLLRLHFKRKNSSDSIAVRCRLIHVVPNGVGILANSSELSKRTREMLVDLMEKCSSYK